MTGKDFHDRRVNEQWHWSKSVSITSILSTLIVGMIIFISWTITGGQWVALADQQRSSTEQMAYKNAKAIDSMKNKITTIETNTGLIQQDSESTKEDVRDIKLKVDKVYDLLLDGRR